MLRKYSKATMFLAATTMALGMVPMQAQAAITLRSMQPGSIVMANMTHGSCLENLQEDMGDADERMNALLTNMEATQMKEGLKESATGKVVAKADSPVVIQVKKYANVRISPDDKAEVVGKMTNNAIGELLYNDGEWVKLTSGSVTGYVKTEYCVVGMEAVLLKEQLGMKFATVTADDVIVRQRADANSVALGMVSENDELTVLQNGQGWIKVETEAGDGYISSEYLKLHTDYTYAESVEEEKARLKKEKEEREAARKKAREAAANAANVYTPFVLDPSTVNIVGDSEMGVAVAQYGMLFIGNPYVYGGASLTQGTDCSGFVMSVYANFGVDLPHSSAADRNEGAKVDCLEDAQPGDLICYSGHVALYIGDGKIVHAANEKNGIIVSPADYKDILAIRRIF